MATLFVTVFLKKSLLTKEISEANFCCRLSVEITSFGYYQTNEDYHQHWCPGVQADRCRVDFFFFVRHFFPFMAYYKDNLTGKDIDSDHIDV